jgi:broad specificity phosphatase PhoE
MAELLLLRHGQASFGASNYDQLSDAGHQQAKWLGEHLNDLDVKIERVVMGSMARHRQTAEYVLSGLQHQPDLEIHPGLNEYNFSGLLAPLQQNFAELWSDTGHARRDYYHNMKQALRLWTSGDIPSDGEDSWQAFNQRIQEGFRFAYEHDAKRTLIVSSGGPIAVLLGQILNLSAIDTCNLSLQVKNTSVSKVLYNRRDFTLDCFNDISHLQTPQRQPYITFS